MTNEEILEGNKLIAGFTYGKPEIVTLSIKFGPELLYCVGNKEYRTENELSFRNKSFHNSWDWLMPVVEKINHCELKPTKESSGWYAFGSLEIWLFEANIEKVFKACVEFIKWYNDERN